MAGTAQRTPVAVCVATVAIAAWEGDIDRDRANAVLNGTAVPRLPEAADTDVAESHTK